MIKKINSFKLSVIIPTYNRVSFLSRAIDSVLNQSFPIDEIIVVDNASNDGTEKFIKENYKSIKLIKEKRIGVSFARNKGIECSKNKWLAFLDSDDEWMSDKIEKQFYLLEKNNFNLQLIHTNEKWFKDKLFKNQKKKHKKKGGYIFDHCLDICKISPSSVLIKKELLYKYGLFDTKFPVCEDYELWLRLTSQIKVGYIEEIKIKKYAGHDGQLSKKYWGIDRYRIKALEKIIHNNTLKNNQKILALKVILKKIDIVTLGAIRRKNRRIFTMYIKKKFLWSECYNKIKTKNTY